MPGGFTPQEDVQIAIIQIDSHLEQSPTATEACLLACPDGVNMQLELLSVGFRANTLPVDSGDAVTFDLEFIDDSNSDTVSNLATAYDMLVANATALVYNQVWRGSKILDPGDVVNAEFSVATPGTPSEGAALIVEFRVVEHS